MIIYCMSITFTMFIFFWWRQIVVFLMLEIQRTGFRLNKSCYFNGTLFDLAMNWTKKIYFSEWICKDAVQLFDLCVLPRNTGSPLVQIECCAEPSFFCSKRGELNYSCLTRQFVFSCELYKQWKAIAANKTTAFFFFFFAGLNFRNCVSVSVPAVDAVVGRLECLCQLPLLGSRRPFKGWSNDHVCVA